MTLRLLVGHVLERLADLPAESVHCVVTSPPYYGLRDYGIEPQVWPDGWRGSLGLELALDLYLDHMVAVFREVRRVMRRDATCWLNIGDSYAGGSVGRNDTGPADLARRAALYGTGTGIGTGPRESKPRPLERGFKPKDLMLIPSRLAIRLCDDGWWVRSDIAWCKRAPMPESCTDRPTTAWEHVFLLTRSAKYFYDAEAVKEPQSEGTFERFGADGRRTGAGAKQTGSPNGLIRDKATCSKAILEGGRNLRNFWLLGPEPFPEAHFATFPTEIPRRAILAGTGARGVCPKCGAPWERVVRKDFHPTQDPQFPKAGQKGLYDHDATWAKTPRGVNDVETIGWRPACGCDASDARPAVVLDPFFGAGTTGLVADQLQRDCIGIELNPEYAEMARRRLTDDAPLFAEVAD